MATTSGSNTDCCWWRSR